MLVRYALLLAATIAIETPLAVAVAGRRQRRDTALAALALNLVTHPLATAAVLSWTHAWLPAELAVLAAEYVGYRALAGLSVPRALAAALLANGTTAALALAVTAA